MIKCDILVFLEKLDEIAGLLSVLECSPLDNDKKEQIRTAILAIKKFLENLANDVELSIDGGLENLKIHQSDFALLLKNIDFSGEEVSEFFCDLKKDIKSNFDFLESFENEIVFDLKINQQKMNDLESKILLIKSERLL